MPYSRINGTTDRYEFEGSLTKRQVVALAKNASLKTLQCCRPVRDSTWDLLNDHLFSLRKDVELRLYGFYATELDLGFVTRLPNVEHFSADCLISAKGAEHIQSMRNLRSLGIGIYELDSFDFLNGVTDALEKLSLGCTKSRKPDLGPLVRFKHLKQVYIERQQKNIEVLSELTHLEDVTLRSISTPNIDYLRPLKKMWSLDVKLGGIKDLSSIEGMDGIKYLELWQIRGLNDISVISTLYGLQYLFLQALRRVSALPSFEKLKQLRRIYLENMKALEDISSLGGAPALEEFIYVSAQNMNPEDCIPLLKNTRVRRVSVGFGSNNKNKQFRELMKEHAVKEYQYSPFKYV